jgi:hypothetical protein
VVSEVSDIGLGRLESESLALDDQGPRMSRKASESLDLRHSRVSKVGGF